MNSHRSCSLAALLVTMVSPPLNAEPRSAETRLPAVFSDHMVLQRGESTAVWGWAPPGQRVSVKFDGQTSTTSADPEGRWQVELRDLKLDAKGKALTVVGDKVITYSDVVVGDVWLASGQSNMAMTVGKSDERDQTIESSADPMLRVMIVRPPVTVLLVSTTSLE